MITAANSNTSSITREKTSGYNKEVTMTTYDLKQLCKPDFPVIVNETTETTIKDLPDEQWLMEDCDFYIRDGKLHIDLEPIPEWGKEYLDREGGWY